MSARVGPSPVRSAQDVLRSIRHVRTVPQLQEAFDGLLTFVRLTRERVESVLANSSPAPTKSTGCDASALLYTPPSLTIPAVISQLKQVSLLCGAYCRRVEMVLRATYAYADVDEASHRGPTAVDVSALMAQLVDEMHSFHTPAVNGALQWLAPAGSAEASVASNSAPLDSVFAYGMGELEDYRVSRRKRAHAYLQQLLAQPQWNTSAITQVIVTLSETVSAPVDTFALCTSDDAVETTCVVTPLRDPVSQTVIRIPARGEHCLHTELFDVESFIQATQQRSLNTVDVGGPCPFCSRPVLLSSIRVDTRALGAMRDYEKTVSSSTSSSTSPAITVDCALEWNTELRTVAVVRGRRGAEQHPEEEERSLGDDSAESTELGQRPSEERQDMKKSISLKEFSTTPTVSYMLSKDGHNVAAVSDAQNRLMNPPPQPVRVERPKQPQPAPDSDDVMYEME